MNTIELSVNDYKAIKKADIVLDGITVLSGVNGSGKSSLSKLLYFAFKYANAYDDIPSEERSKLLSICHAINSMRYDPFFRDAFNKKNVQSNLLFFSERSFDELRNYAIESLNRFKEVASHQLEERTNSKQQSENRIKKIISDSLDRSDSNASLHELLEEMIGRVDKLNASLSKRNETRPYKDYKLKLDMSVNYQIKDVTIKEYGVPFVGKGVTTVPILHYIQNVVYVDSPMIVGSDGIYNEVEYWKDLHKLLLLPRQKSYSKTIFYELRDQIMHGEGMAEDDSFFDSFRYNRDDGQTFPLFDSATGIKSFSVLQMLLRNGVINKNTLLIIDEPEAHLHPQWIVEYARIVVQIHKAIGTKFFIASHSTDFVSAIRYIAAKQNQLKSLNYYLGKEAKDKEYMFDYQHLGNDIEPIFASFNKSYEKLSEYGI